MRAGDRRRWHSDDLEVSHVAGPQVVRLVGQTHDGPVDKRHGSADLEICAASESLRRPLTPTSDSDSHASDDSAYGIGERVAHIRRPE